MAYDLLIVGAGAAGLHLGIQWLKQHKGTCCIIEASAQLGGRVATYRKGKLHWEEGAGRIALSHQRTLSLLKRYHLHTIPIPTHPSRFYELYDALIKPLRLLPSHVLCNHTLGSLLLRIHGPSIEHVIQQFPYWSEIYLQRADVSLNAFENSMGKSEKFVVCQEGLSSMIDGMANEFTELGGVIRHSVKAMKVREGSVSCLVHHTNDELIEAKKIVLALAHGSLCKLYERSRIKDNSLHHIAMSPLIRIYAVFKQNVSIPYMVVDSHIRYVIPISPKVVMISYTDGGDATYWANRIKQDGEKAVVQSVMKELQTYCDKPLPTPVDFAIHHWSEGCSYWLPGNYSVHDMSKKLLHSPLKSVYVCGESYAEEPCWIESALIQAEKLLPLL
jgi:predicted NAD/FAD-dependent oxidoreductase